jgi:hypothetical protein
MFLECQHGHDRLDISVLHSSTAASSRALRAQAHIVYSLYLQRVCDRVDAIGGARRGAGCCVGVTCDVS